MCQLIIHHHGRDEVVTPVRTNNPDTFAYRGEDGGLHTIPTGQIVHIRIPVED